MSGQRLARLAAVACLTTALLGAATGEAEGAPTTAPAVATSSATADRGYVTLLFGRALWAQTDNRCAVLDNAVPLNTVAAALKARGKRATVNVIVDRTLADVRMCWHHYTLHASWRDLATLRDTYGWTAVSAGQSYADMTTLLPVQQWTESCGSLKALSDHGHRRGWGLFAYPNNRRSADIQRSVVSTCFAYGRQYGQQRNLLSAMRPPWFQQTVSVNGGRCSRTDLPCSTITVRNDRRYTSPQGLQELVQVAAHEWAVVQWYRLVRNANTSTQAGFRWDCTGRDWRTHWSSDPEIYCLNDFLSVVDSIPRTAAVTDPATVAIAWGRTPG